MFSLSLYRYDFTNGAIYQIHSITDIDSVPYLARKRATIEFDEIIKSLIYKTRNEVGGGFTFVYDEYSCHLWKTDRGLYSFVVTNQHYAQPEAFKCCRESLVDIVKDNTISEVYAFTGSQDLDTSCIETNFSKWREKHTSRELELQEEVMNVKTIFCDNINSITDMNESLDDMALKSDRLKETAFKMKKTSRKVRCFTACTML